MSPRSRQLVSTGSPFEPRIGFSRAVRSGRVIAVSGTAPIGARAAGAPALPEGEPEVAAQARRCIEIIGEALDQAGASLADVVRTRIYLVRIEDWEAVGRVHGEFFRDIRPASTMVQVSRLIDPSWLVEIEADAVIEEE